MTHPDAPPNAAQVGRNAAIIATATAVVRVSGLLREVIFANFFGAGMATDAYNAAFRAAQFFRELLAEGSLANVYVPVFADIEQKDGLKAAWRLANAFLGVLLLALGVITIGTFVFAEGWVYAVAWGFSEDPAKFELTASLTRILAPFLATVSLASLCMGMLNVRGRFFLPAVAPATFNVAVIVACFLKGPWEAATGTDGILLVGIASVIGGAGQFLVQIPALLREGWRIRPSLKGHPALKRLFLFMIPAFVGITTVQFNLLVESQLASRFGDGPVSYLQYAFRLVQLPNSIVAAAVGTAALAGLSTLVAAGRRDQLPEALGEAITLNSFLVLPASVGLYLLADPVIALMYERGAFSTADAQATASVLRMYAIATWGIGMHRVLLPSYYALGHPWYAMGVALVTMAAKLPVALLLVYTLGMGFIGLPLSHGVLVTAEVAVLWWGLSARAGGLPRQVYGDHLRMAVAAALMGVLLWVLRPWSHGPMLLPVVALAGAGYFVAAHALGVQASAKVFRRVLPGRRPKGLPPSVDPDTRDALALLLGSAQGSVELRESVLHIETSAGRFELRAADRQLRLARVGDGQGSGEPLPVQAVMRVGQGPPVLHGVILAGVAYRAKADEVVEGLAPGPVLPVA
jgi:putative peptidoglycan lipid II flippase